MSPPLALGRHKMKRAVVGCPSAGDGVTTVAARQPVRSLTTEDNGKAFLVDGEHAGGSFVAECGN